MINKALLTLSLMLLAGTIALHAQRSIFYADKQFEAFNFEAAVELYKSALDGKKEMDKSYVLTRIGDSYRLMNNPSEAEAWYAKAVSYDGVKTETIFHYAQMLRANQKYEAAITEFERYADKAPGDRDVKQIIDGLYRIEELSRVNPEYDVRIAPFNTEGSDFGPFVYKNKLYYTTNGRPSSATKEDVWTGKIFLELYQVDVSGYDQFSDIRQVKNNMNGLYHDGPVCVDQATGDMYITRSNYIKRKASHDDKDVVNLKIMRKTMTSEGEWSQDIMDDFPFNSTDYSVGHATVSKDGQTIYFASDMPHDNAMGGVDIYKATRSGDTWDNLQNLGGLINSSGDDMFPFISGNGHLFYASNGKAGLGGLDIFEAVPGSNGWSMVYNMGAPLNTNYDDFALVFRDGKRDGYFTSNRPGEFDDDDIYSFKDNGILLVGTVVDALTRQPVCTSNVDLVFAGANTSNALTACDGKFRFSVKPNNDYKIKACADGYFCNADINGSTKGAVAGDVIEVEVPVRKDVPIEMTVLVVDEKTGQPISTSIVNLFDGCSGKRQNGKSDVAGKSNFVGSEGCDNYITAMAPSYFPKDTLINTAGITGSTEIVVKLGKQGMFDVGELEDGLVFYHIYYDFDESYIRPDADPDLHRVLRFMQDNPEAVVQVESHTDARAQFQYNKDLSERRAAAARSWLMNKGIAETRLQSVGFGEIRPVNGCIDNVHCTEKEHQMNRRTEFRIIAGRVDTRSLDRFDVKVDPCMACPF